MQENFQFFRVEQADSVQGKCTELISPQQPLMRNIQKYQKPPFRPIAKHLRNITYTPLNTRTQQSLVKSMDYLAQNIFPIMLAEAVEKQIRWSVAIFIEERLKAIRCQYFVQGIINPRELLRICKGFVVVQIMKENQGNSNDLVGIQQLLLPQNQEIMVQKFKNQYKEALKIAILSINRMGLQRLLIEHPLCLQQQQLRDILQLRLKIQNGNYHSYYCALENKQILVKFLLWRKINSVSEKLSSIVKKSFHQIPLNWLFKRLGFKNDPIDPWVSVKVIPQPNPQKYIGFLNWINLSQISLIFK